MLADPDGDGSVSHDELARFLFEVWTRKLQHIRNQLKAIESTDFVPSNTQRKRLVAARRSIEEAIQRNVPRHIRDDCSEHRSRFHGFTTSLPEDDEGRHLQSKPSVPTRPKSAGTEWSPPGMLR